MKKYFFSAGLLVLALFLLSHGGFAQRSWDGGAGTPNWGDANNWDNNAVPLASETVTIDLAAANLTVNVNGNYTCAGLTLTRPNNALSNVGGNHTLVIPAGSSLTVNGNVSVVNSSTGGTNNSQIDVQGGTLTITGNYTHTQSGNDNRDCNLLISTATTALVDVRGTITMGAAAGRNNLNFSTAGTLRIGGAGTCWSNGTVTFFTGCTVVYDGNAAQTIRTFTTYRNLTVKIRSDATANRTKTLGGATTVNENLVIESDHATFTASLNPSNQNFTVAGTTTINARGVFIDDSNAGANTFTGQVTINTNGSFSPTSASSCFFANGIDNYGTFNRSGAGNNTFQTNSQTIRNRVGGTFTLAGNTTFASSATIGDTIIAESPMNFTGSTNNINHNVVVRGNSKITYSGGFSILDNRSFTNQNTDTVRVDGNINGGGANANFINSTNATLDYRGANAPMVTGILTATANPNAIVYNRNGTQTVRATTYHHLVLANANIKTFAGATQVNGNLTVTGTATIASLTANLTVDSLMTYETTGATNIVGTSTIALSVGGFVQKSGTFVGVNSSGRLNLTVGDSLSVHGGTFTAVSGTGSFYATAQNMVIRGGTCNGATNTGDDTLQIANQFLMTGGTLNLGSATGGQTIITTGSMSMSGSATITQSEGMPTAVSKIILTSASASPQTVSFAGSATWGVGSVTNANFARMEINDADGINISGNVRVPGVVFTDGRATTGSPDTLIILSPREDAISGASTSRYVVGNLTRTLPNATAGNYLYPIGTASAYNPAILVLASNATTGSDVRVNLRYESSGAAGGTGFGLITDSNNPFYWRLNVNNNYANFSGVNIRLVPNGYSLTSQNKIGYSTTNATNSYITRGGTISGDTIISTVSFSGSPVGYFAIWDKGSFPCSGTVTTYEIGDGAPIFQKMSQVAPLLNESDIDCHLIFEFRSDYVGTSGETFPIQFNQFTYGVGGPYTVAFRPKLGVSGVVTGNTNATQIIINGADYLKLDGRAGGVGTTKNWTIASTSQTNSTITFKNDAIRDTLQYLVLRGDNDSKNGGVILIADGAVTGNDSLVIQYNDIREATGAHKTRNGIFAYSSVGLGTNDNVQILNNNIFNYFTNSGARAAATLFPSSTVPLGCNYAPNGMFGIYLSCGTSAWKINGNSFYQTATRTISSGGADYVAIYINSIGGSGYEIKNNYVGGTAPMCGGTPMTYNGGVNMVRLRAIVVYSIGNTSETVIEGNVITNITVDYSLTTGAELTRVIESAFGKEVKITKNYIGDASSAPTPISGSITYNHTGTSDIPITYRGIYVLNDAAKEISDNVVGNFIIQGTNTTGQNFTGIYIDSMADMEVTRNIVSGLTSTAVRGVGGAGMQIVRGNGHVHRNRIYGTRWNTADTTLTPYSGLSIGRATGDTLNIYNNMITVGYNHPTNQPLFGVLVYDHTTAFPVQIIHNSVFITGSMNIPSSQHTYGLYRPDSGVAHPIVMRNNIFYNARQKYAGGAAHHVAVGVENATAADFNTDYNLLTAEVYLPSRQQNDSLAYFAGTVYDSAGWLSLSFSPDDSSTIGPTGGAKGLMEFQDPATGDLTPIGSNLCDYATNGIRASNVNDITLCAVYYNPGFPIANDYFDSARIYCTPNIGAVEFTTTGIWQGSVSTDWHNPDNWCGKTVPNATINARIVEGPVPPVHFPRVLKDSIAIAYRLLLYDNPSTVASGIQPLPAIDGPKMLIDSGATMRVFADILFTGGSQNKILASKGSRLEMLGDVSQTFQAAYLDSTAGFRGWDKVSLGGVGVKTTVGSVYINDTLNMSGSALLNIGAGDTLTLAGDLVNVGTFGGANTATMRILGSGAFPSSGSLPFSSGTYFKGFELNRVGSPTVNFGSALGADSVKILQGNINNGGNNITVGKYLEIASGMSHSGSGKLILTQPDTLSKFYLVGAGNFGNVELNDTDNGMSGVFDTAFAQNDLTVRDLTITRGTFSLRGSNYMMNNNLTVQGNYTRNTTSTRLLYGTGTVTFAGTSAQTLNTPADTFGSLVLNNANGFTLNSGNIVTNTGLTLTAGVFNTNGNELFLTSNNPSALTGGSSTAYVAGCLRRGITGTQDYLFPIGRTFSYAPFFIEFVTALGGSATNILGCFVDAAPGNDGLPDTMTYSGSDYVFNSMCSGYWTVEPNSSSYGTPNYSITVDSSVFFSCGGIIYNLFKRDNGATPWTRPGTFVNSFKRSGLTTFSHFGVGGAATVLPVDILSFNALLRHQEVVVRWQVAAERNIASYTVERSTDGKSFEPIAHVPAEALGTHTYIWADKTVKGLSGTVYYRLKINETAGKSTYSPIVSVVLAPIVFDVIAYPNPIQSSLQITISNGKADNYTVAISDNLGREVAQYTLKGLAGETTFIPEQLAYAPSGIYVVKVTDSNGVQVIRRVVKQ